MKSIIRNIAVYTFVLFLLPQIIPGVHIGGGFWTLLIGGVALALMFLILKPILNIISFPVNMLTLGLFSVFTNVLILYLLTVFVTSITIEAFTYERMNFRGFVIPTIHFTIIFAYIFTSFILSVIDTVINWIID